MGSVLRTSVALHRVMASAQFTPVRAEDPASALAIVSLNCELSCHTKAAREAVQSGCGNVQRYLREAGAPSVAFSFFASASHNASWVALNARSKASRA